MLVAPLVPAPCVANGISLVHFVPVGLLFPARGELVAECRQHGRVRLSLVAHRLRLGLQLAPLVGQLGGLAAIVGIPLVALRDLIERDLLGLAVDRDGDHGLLGFGRLGFTLGFRRFALSANRLVGRLLRLGLSNALTIVGVGFLLGVLGETLACLSEVQETLHAERRFLQRGALRLSWRRSGLVRRRGRHGCYTPIVRCSYRRSLVRLLLIPFIALASRNRPSITASACIWYQR